MKVADRQIDYPYLRERQSGRFPRIEIGGDSMRVGKTTALKVIAEGLRSRGLSVCESYEDWQHNPHLKRSYEDPKKAFLLSQKWFIRRKWEQVRDGASGAVYLQDVHPEMDYCYAVTNMVLGRMYKRDFQAYDQFFRGLNWAEAPAPDLLVYLKATDKALLERAESSRREFETVDDGYFLAMKTINRNWLKGVKERYNVLCVETDHFDYAHDEKAKAELLSMVESALLLL